MSMLKIREARLKAGLTQPKFLQGLALHGCKISVPDLSRYENGHSYPNPYQAISICKVADITLGELASPSDVRFCARVVKSAASMKKAPRRTKSARVTFRVLASEKPRIDEALQICGYATLQSWGDKVKSDLLDEAARKQAEREFPPEGCPMEPVEPGSEYDPFKINP